MLTTAVSNNLAETEQINFRLWAGGQFTLRKPLCAYGLIAQPVQLSALPGRAPTNRPPRSGLFLFRAASVGGLFHFKPSEGHGCLLCTPSDRLRFRTIGPLT